MKKVIIASLALTTLSMVSCSDDDNVGSGVTAPQTYKFERNGSTSVSYSGQTTRIKMGEEFIAALKDPSKTEAQLDAMFAHVEGNNDFSEAELNASDKSIRSKTAASRDYFSTNTAEANTLKAKFDGWIAAQVSEVFPNWNTLASEGVAGQIQEAGGGSIRYVSAKGLEYNQAINKGLIGGLMVDQMLNNYLGTAVLDEASNISDNNSDILATDKNYTTMEHKWDEAFGYLYGTDDAENPQYGADSFLSKYVARVEGDADFAGISQEIYDAFKLGRAAIVAKNYNVRNQQASIIRNAVSKIIAIRAVYYLQQAKATLANDKASAFHDLSEGFGFIQSLRFTRNTTTNTTHLPAADIEGYLTTLMADNGFWDVTNATLDDISTKIANAYGFTVAEAAN
ncbi:DUF4856 domain-containing protein [Tenacibaculum sp. 190524A05c]|uniref:DUF4856 domain-containing protein n=1 Tax=Tenacibaculum platacis TaxID=3137852 RepID=UPI0032B1AA31